MNKYGQIKDKVINIPALTPTGRRDWELDTPADYDTMRGYYIIRTKGTDYIKVGISTQGGTVLTDPVPMQHYEVEKSLPIEKRFFKRTPCKAKSNKLIIQTETFTNTVEQEFIVLFQYDNLPLQQEHNLKGEEE